MQTKYALTIQEAAKRSGLGRSSIYRFLTEGKLKARKAGRRTLIMADELEKLINSLPEATFGGE